MVRHTIATTGLLLLAAALLPTAPARAQFSTIFGSNNNPPRPPADIPSGQQQPPYYPSRQAPQQRPNYPPPAGQPSFPEYRHYPAVQAQPVQQQPSQPAANRDEPPAQPMPAPMSLPPSARPGGGTIESQPLAPPPGTQPAQQANTPNKTQPANPNAPAASQQSGAKQEANEPPAGQQQPGVAPPPAATENPPTKEVVMRPPPERITNPTAVFEGLDKITGRTTRFDVAINETVQFGALQVTPKACYSRPPTETPQTDAFVDVDEVTLKGKIRRIFTGWMFKSSPGLHAVEHPIYDVWLINCKGGKNPDVADASDSNSSQRASAKPAHEAKSAKPPARHNSIPAPRARPSAQSRGFLPAIR